MNIPIAKIDNHNVIIASHDIGNDNNMITIDYEPKQLINQIAFLEVIQNNSQEENITIDRYRYDYSSKLCYRLKIYYFLYILIFVILMLLVTHKSSQTSKN